MALDNISLSLYKKTFSKNVFTDCLSKSFIIIFVEPIKLAFSFTKHIFWSRLLFFSILKKVITKTDVFENFRSFRISWCTDGKMALKVFHHIIDKAL